MMHKLLDVAKCLYCKGLRFFKKGLTSGDELIHELFQSIESRFNANAAAVAACRKVYLLVEPDAKSIPFVTMGMAGSGVAEMSGLSNGDSEIWSVDFVLHSRGDNPKYISDMWLAFTGMLDFANLTGVTGYTCENVSRQSTTFSFRDDGRYTATINYRIQMGLNTPKARGT